MIAKLPAKELEALDKRYGSITLTLRTKDDRPHHRRQPRRGAQP
jgi:hypothetical protein